MLDVHPPHEPVHGLKSYLVHISTIVVGLFIALAIEQTVVHVHERHQRLALDEQLLDVLRIDLDKDEVNRRSLSNFRSYLVEQRAAILARLHGKVPASAPPSDDPRMTAPLRFPSLAPYEAARANGTIALLPTDSIRVYNRLSYARDNGTRARERWVDTYDAWSAFHERFNDSAGPPTRRHVTVSSDLAMLSPAELDEYLKIVSTLIKTTDRLLDTLDVFDIEARVILAGERDEDKMVEAISRSATAQSPAPASTGR